MTEAKLFKYEMMDTPTLSQECHRLKAEIDAESDAIRLGKGNVSYKRGLMAELKKAKQILKVRQLKMF